MGFNRNIIIQADINRLMDSSKSNPQTLSENPPAGFIPALAPKGGEPANAGGDGRTALGGVSVPTEDSYLTKLLKYVPVEVVGAYLFLASIIDNNVSGSKERAIWLGGLLIGVLVLTIPYDRQVLNVVRWPQITVSVVGVAVYVFALGGWFATTTWYHQWYAGIVIPVFALAIAVLKLPPLPEDPTANAAPKDQKTQGQDRLNPASPVTRVIDG